MTDFTKISIHSFIDLLLIFIMRFSFSKYLLLTLTGYCIVQIGCEDTDSSPNTNKYTYYDDISDITYLNNSFYTTNYDLSGNAGEQIDLIVYDIILYL